MSFLTFRLFLSRSIDLHTNIATAVVSEITTRGLDKLFEAEDNFENASLTSCLQQLEKLLESGEKGSLLSPSFVQYYHLVNTDHVHSIVPNSRFLMTKSEESQ